MLRSTTRLIATLALLFGSSAAFAQERPHRSEEVIELLEMLELGAKALDELGRDELRDEVLSVAHALERVEDARRDREPEDSDEREIAEQRIELFRLARKAVAEAGMVDRIERIELAIHAHELAIEGDRSSRAMEAREHAPDWRESVELLGLAARLYDEYDMPDRADMIRSQRDRLWRGWRERAQAERDEHDARREREKRAGDRERTLAMERLEMMRMAMPALREAERKDTAELLERAMHALEVNLEGREDPKAREIRRQSPGLPEQIEILAYAARLWEEFGHETKAAKLDAYSKDMLAAWQKREARRRGDASEPEGAEPAAPSNAELGMKEMAQQIDALHRRMVELERLLVELVQRQRSEGERDPFDGKRRRER